MTIAQGPPRWVEAYLEIPFKRGGREQAGCDCFGLVRLVLARCAGIVLPDYCWVDARSRADVSDAIRAASVDEVWHPIAVYAAQAFDLVPMSGLVKRQDGMVETGEVHIGIMVSAVHVLHTEEESGPACVPIFDKSVALRLIPQKTPIVRRHHTLCKS